MAAAVMLISTAMFPAGMIFTMMMVVMAALDVGIKFQFAGHQIRYRLVRLAGYAAIQPDTGSP